MGCGCRKAKAKTRVAPPATTEIVYQAEGGSLEEPVDFSSHSEAKLFAKANGARVRSAVRSVAPSG